MDEIITWIIIGFLLFLFFREIMCWYWKINDIIKNQEAQLNLMDEMIIEMKQQNQRLQDIITEKEVQKESTPQ